MSKGKTIIHISPNCRVIFNKNSNSQNIEMLKKSLQKYKTTSRRTHGN